MSDVNIALPQTVGAPPTGGQGQGFPLPQGEEYKPPKKGGLPIGVIASIQLVYAREEQKQDRLQGTQQLGLQPGWGGQGRA